MNPKTIYEKDSDHDGLTDAQELALGTDPYAIDTDGDGVPDCKDKELITPTSCQPVDADGVGKCSEPECCKNMKPAVVEKPCPSDYPSLSYTGQNYKLTNDLKNMITAVAAKMKANPNCNIVINGYPEASKGSQALCQQRVDAVKMQLVQKEGISAEIKNAVVRTDTLFRMG